MRVLIFFSAIGVCAVLGAVALKPDATGKRQADKREADDRQRLEVCRDSMKDKTRIPIMGGGVIDTSRYSSKIPIMKVSDDGECAAVGIEEVFFWTGEKIVTDGEVPRVDLPGYGGRIKIQDIPQHWRDLRVSAGLDNRRLDKACKAHFDPKKCPDYTYRIPRYPSSWPEHLIVRPKAYPDLEIWLPENGSSTEVGYHTVGWPGRDGITPRLINCFGITNFPSVENMIPAQLEQLDFAEHRHPCHVEHESFDFNGGSAFVRLDTALLPSAVPALKALQAYISNSIIKED